MDFLHHWLIFFLNVSSTRKKLKTRKTFAFTIFPGRLYEILTMILAQSFWYFDKLHLNYLTDWGEFRGNIISGSIICNFIAWTTQSIDICNKTWHENGKNSYLENFANSKIRFSSLAPPKYKSKKWCQTHKNFVGILKLISKLTNVIKKCIFTWYFDLGVLQ